MHCACISGASTSCRKELTATCIAHSCVTSTVMLLSASINTHAIQGLSWPLAAISFWCTAKRDKKVSLQNGSFTALKPVASELSCTDQRCCQEIAEHEALSQVNQHREHSRQLASKTDRSLCLRCMCILLGTAYPLRVSIVPRATRQHFRVVCVATKTHQQNPHVNRRAALIAAGLIPSVQALAAEENATSDRSGFMDW